MVQLHKRFTDSQVKELIERYLKKDIDRRYIQEVLGIGKTRFFTLIKAYRHNPQDFSVHYTRATHTRTIPQEVERNILRELQIEKHLIEDKDVPLRGGKDRVMKYRRFTPNR
jgi:hypothetical protein